MPPIAVVTRACLLDWGSPFFREAEQRPIITAASAASQDRARAAQVADLILAGDDQVDLALALRALGDLGHDNVLAEGGPSVAAQLASGDLLDELCITLSPVLTAGDAGRILNRHPIEPPTRLELHHVLESEDSCSYGTCADNRDPRRGEASTPFEDYGLTGDTRTAALAAVGSVLAGASVRFGCYPVFRG